MKYLLLNNIYARLRWNLPVFETPHYFGGYGTNYNIVNQLQLLPLQFRTLSDLFQVLKGFLSFKPDKKLDIYKDKDNSYLSPPRHYGESLALRAVYSRDSEKMRKRVLDEVVELYDGHERILNGISKGFGIPIHVFYQPSGVKSLKNPFIINVAEYKANALYQYTSYVMSGVVDQIKSKRYPHYVDISDVDRDCSDCYVDIGHYDSKLSRLIAAAIFHDL